MSSKLSIMALEIADRSKCSCYCRENIWWWNLEQQEGCALGGLQSFISSIFYVTCSNFISLFVLEIYYKIIHVCSPHILSFWSSWANFVENISWPALGFFFIIPKGIGFSLVDFALMSHDWNRYLRLGVWTVRPQASK